MVNALGAFMGLNRHLSDQLRGIDLQCSGQVEEGLQRWAPPAPFKETDVGSVIAAFEAEGLLGQSASLTKPAQHQAKRLLQGISLYLLPMGFFHNLISVHPESPVFKEG